MFNLPKTKIGNKGKTLEFNIIQGGMGVGVSASGLASAVANCGGMGIIASVGLGSLKNYKGSYVEANRNGLRDEIRTARKKSNGVIGVNIMHALSDYDSLVKTAVEENVDVIISGAGIPRDLPSYVGDKDIKLIPIVSSLRVVEMIVKSWKKYDGKVPDAIIVEGPLAGGHLGYSYEDLIYNTAPTLERIASEIIEFANDKTNFEKPIPVIVAGGIYSGKDIKYFREKIKASGVQMATLFVPTLECDADDKFKKKYLDARREDIIIIKSPVGLPGRAIKNEFLESVEKGENKKFSCPYNCLKTCEPKKSPYCIANALIEARKGDFTRGYAFCGENVYRCTPQTCLDKEGKFITVQNLIQNISDEFNS